MTTSEVMAYISDVTQGNLDRKCYLERLMVRMREQNTKMELFSKLHEKPQGKSEGALAGLPISVKDNICVKGFPTRAGSKILREYHPPFDATVVSRIRDAGGAFVGTTNMDEFGFGTFSTNCAYGLPKNPFDTNRSCGGSSGGAAGATAILKNHIAIAESTGGSISCPAAFCGVVGFTPTYGRVSRFGLIDYANSLDKIGVMTRSVEDLRIILPIISGRDPNDMTSQVQPPLDSTEKEIRKIGIPKELIGNITDKKILETFWQAIDKMRQEGVDAEEVSIPTLEYSIPAYYILACAEASTNLAKFCGMRYGLEGQHFDSMYNNFFTEVRSSAFGQEAKRRIMLGTFARMAGYRDQYYMKALRIRRKMIEEFERAFKGIALLASPTMPLLPPRFDEIEDMSPATVYALDFLTVPPNLAGLPHISMPMGYANDLPMGIHLIAPHWEEGRLLSAGRIWERKMEYRFPMDLEGFS